MNANINPLNTTGAALSQEESHAVSGGFEQFPVNGQALYVKIFGRWVPTGTEPYFPVDLDGEHTPK
jgi:hypothetical protein